MSGLSAIAIALTTVGCQLASPPVETPAEPTSPPPAITPKPLSVEPKTYVDGVQLPVSLQFAPDGGLFFVEVNKGQVRIAQNGVLREEPFASLEVAKGAEQGLLGLVLHLDSAKTAGSIFITPCRTRAGRLISIASYG